MAPCFWCQCQVKFCVGLDKIKENPKMPTKLGQALDNDCCDGNVSVFELLVVFMTTAVEFGSYKNGTNRTCT